MRSSKKAFSRGSRSFATINGNRGANANTEMNQDDAINKDSALRRNIPVRENMGNPGDDHLPGMTRGDRDANLERKTNTF